MWVCRPLEVYTVTSGYDRIQLAQLHRLDWARLGGVSHYLLLRNSLTNTLLALLVNIAGLLTLLECDTLLNCDTLSDIVDAIWCMRHPNC